MAKRSDTHSGATLSDGAWKCSVCESESGDFELFEEAGEIENCLERGRAAGVVPGTDDLVAWAEVERAREWMDQARVSLGSMGAAANKAAAEIKMFGDALSDIGDVVSSSDWYTAEMSKRRTTITSGDFNPA